MFYKIVGVSDQCPDKPVVYKGEMLQLRTDEHPILTAMNTVFGDPNLPAVQALKDWSGGEVNGWQHDLPPGSDEESFQFFCDDTIFHVFLGEEAFD